MLRVVRTSPLAALERPLAPRARGELERALLALLKWQVALDGWPRRARAPDAMPIVSVYADGELRGCAGSTEGSPGERLARAFLYATSDVRFGGVSAQERPGLVAQVAYPLRVRRVPLARAAAIITPGAHGLALVLPDASPALLLPDVAREHSLDAAGFLEALEHKSGVARAAWPDALFSFETEVVTVQLGRPLERAEHVRRVDRREGTERARRVDRLEAAVRWLAARVGADGRVAFGIDPRTGEASHDGVFLHGRAAIALRALSAHPAGRVAAARARRWLTRDLAAALGGRAVPSFPREVPLVVGTLALAKLAGVPFDAPLAELARRPELEAVPWHAAQVVCALGAEAPDRLYRACVKAAEREPLAPWTVLAARARGDRRAFERLARALATHVAKSGLHAGGVGQGTLPELALTAAVAEALTGANARPVAAARERALRFIERLQNLSPQAPAFRRPALAFGAFPLTPVHAFLRTDVTAHAVLALVTATKP
jgi:AMMECR1 domain-containing protein